MVSLLAALVITTVAWQFIRITNSDYQVFLIGVTYQADRFIIAFVGLTLAIFLGTQIWALRRVNRIELAAGSLIVWGVAVVATSISVATFSPLFLWPQLAALAVLGLTVLRPSIAARDWVRTAGFVVLLLPTMLLMVPAALLFQTLGGRIEILAGLPMMALPVLWAALSVELLLPLVPLPRLRRPWLAPAVIAFSSLFIVVSTSATSGFTVDQPKPNMVMYDLNADTGFAHWLTTAGTGPGLGRTGLVDAWTSQFLGDNPEAADVAGWSAGLDVPTPGFRAAAPAADLQPPALTVVGDQLSGDTRTLRLRMTSPRGATDARMHLDVSPAAITIAGTDANIEQLDASEGLWIFLGALTPVGVEITLTASSSGPLAIEVHDWSPGLPILPNQAIHPRPTHMVPSAHDLTETTMVRRTYRF